MRPDEVVVTGLGLISPAGVGVRENWSRVCAGKPTAAADPVFAGLPTDFSCRVTGFDSRSLTGVRQAWRLDRYTQFALTAAQEALADARLDPGGWDGARVAVVIGTASGGVETHERAHQRFLEAGYPALSPLTIPGFLPNMAAGQIAIAVGARGPALSVATACASGATAIGTALALLRSRHCDLAIAGGAEAMATRFCAAAYAKMGALSTRRADIEGASRPFDADRDGFVLGEGAGVLVLERADDAVGRGITPRAILAGYGASADAYDPVAPDPEGRGGELALRRMLADADVHPAQVDYVNAHATSTHAGDLAEAGMLRRVLRHGPAVSSTKGVTGHTLGAAGAIEAAFAVLSIEEGRIPPTANLERLGPGIDLDIVAGEARQRPISLAVSQSFGFGGSNAALAFRPFAA